jgi:membrane associated rhomboid family serine protease
MLPVGSRDAADPTKAFPAITVGLVVVNVLVFLYELTVPSDRLNAFFNSWALVPCEYTNQCALYPGTPVPLFITMFTSMFLHGGWDHLLGNMLFLLVFGIHVERSMGRLRFFLFYFVCGLGANLLEIVTAAGSNVPGIGASGAIAGVLAGYLLLYPSSHIDALLPLGRFYWPTVVPAWIFIGLWFLYQLALSVISFGDLSAGGGVAYSAHVGGFVTGLILVRIFSHPEWVDVIRARQQRTA